MCGIYGYIGTPKNPEVMAKFMRILAIVSEERGTDGAGFVALTDDELITEKSAVKASEFFELSEYFHDAIVNKKANIFIGHNRAASVGEISTKNTQPYVGDSWALVHNGTMGDEAFDLAKKYRVKSKIEGSTDSEAFMRVVDKKGFTGELLNEVECYAIVACNFLERKVLFAKDHHRPLAVFDLRKTLGVRIFCSTRPLVNATIKYTNGAGLTNIKAKKMKSWYLKNLHMYTIDLDSLEFDNLGRYEDDPEPVEVEFDDEPVEYVVHEPTIGNTSAFGRRGYIAPASALANPRVEYGE